jgi:hypothetical protein
MYSGAILPMRHRAPASSRSFAEQLRGSEYAHQSSLNDIPAIAQRLAPQLANVSDIQEFTQLVERAKTKNKEQRAENGF